MESCLKRAEFGGSTKQKFIPLFLSKRNLVINVQVHAVLNFVVIGMLLNHFN